MRPCLNQSCFPGFGAVDFVEVAAKSGVPSVELRTMDERENPAIVAAAVRSAGVRVEAVNALMDWALRDDPAPRPRLDYLLAVAHGVEAPLIVCVAPIRTVGLPPTEHIVQSASERLAELTEAARSTGVRLAFEQVGQSSTRPGAQSGIRRLADARSVVEAAGPDAVLTLDSFNLATAGESYDAIRSIPRERIGIAHLIDRDPQTGGRTLPGDGNLGVSAFVDALRSTGYDGALSLEILPAVPWPDPVAFAHRAMDRMREYTDY